MAGVSPNSKGTGPNVPPAVTSEQNALSTTPSNSDAFAPSQHGLSASREAQAIVDEARESQAGMLERTARAFGGDMAEARSLDTVNRLDEEVEKHFKAGLGTSGSPAFRAVWDKEFPTGLFFQPSEEPSPECARAMDRCCQILRDRKEAGLLFGADGKVAEETLAALGEAGYWGMLIPKEWGGQAASFLGFTRFLANVAKIDPSVAGLCSIHGCIGAVDPLIAFGNPIQQAAYLPKLASGEKLSAFALTEPGAGSDLTAVKTTARLIGDKYYVNGEKLFITNVAPGRTIGLVCLIDGKPSALVVDLPKEPSENFRFKDYGLYALGRLWNRGMVFTNFEVPKENLLDPTKAGTVKGDGLTIAYHGLNRGRIALCANAGGTMAGLLADVIPWAEQRITYAKSIGERQLVRSRLGHMATQIVGCEAISTWCAKLLDAGYRGELECIVAKNFGSEAQKTVAIEDFMRTHGGRSFLKGHTFGDNVHDLLAPMIYEGEGDMLSMGFLKSLIKDHAGFFTPIADKVAKLKEAGELRKNFDPGNGTPGELWKLRAEVAPYAMWLVRHKVSEILSGFFGSADKLPSTMPKELKKHLAFSAVGLRGMVSKIDGEMRKYGPALQDEQCILVDLSRDTQNLLMIAVVACWGSEQSDPTLVKCAELLCQELTNKVTGGRLGARYRRGLAGLGRDVIEGKFSPINGVARGSVLQPYDELRRKA